LRVSPARIDANRANAASQPPQSPPQRIAERTHSRGRNPSNPSGYTEPNEPVATARRTRHRHRRAPAAESRQARRSPTRNQTSRDEWVY